MNYIRQLNAFYKIVPIKQVSPNAKNLYETLLYINSSCFWKSDFTVANLYLMTLTGLNKQAIYRARNELIQKELIDFKKGINQNEAGKYTIIEFVTADDTADETALDTASETADDTAGDTINKLNKTKHIKENIKKKYGENQNVLFTDEEYGKVKAYFPNDYEKRIQALDDYIQSKGKKYKDFVATLKSWARREGYKPPDTKTEKKEELKEVDLSSLTPEEYGLLMQKKITIKELIEKGRVHVG